jgi:hypothetical protein
VYTAADLTDAALSDASQAIAWARFIVRDTEEPYTYHDVELMALLNGTAVRYEAATFYRPHYVAATLIRTDPDRAISESIDNASKTKPDPDVIADRIMRAYRFIDDRIDELTDVPLGNVFEAVL